jgi:hypothetical protein
MYEDNISLLGKPLTMKIIDSPQPDVYSVLAVTKGGDGWAFCSYCLWCENMAEENA